MARRSKEDALATRNLILDVAEQVFVQRGVSRTSLQEIAQGAGLSRGAIYWHFKDKADLFNAIMQRVLLPMEQLDHRLADARGDAIADLRERCIGALARIVANEQVRRVFEIAIHKVEYVDELEAVRDRRLDVSRLHLAYIERVILQEIKAGAPLRRSEAREAALGLHSLLEGLIQHWMLDPAAFDLVKAGTRLIDTYLAGLGLIEPSAGRAGTARPPPRALKPAPSAQRRLPA